MAQITDQISLAVAALNRGELVAMPTETVYGLAADAGNEDAVAKVFALKGRPATNPLIVHVADSHWIRDWAAEVGASAEALMAAFWPGPLTLVLPAKAEVSRAVTAGQDTVALRMPAHPQALALLKDFGRALVAPSANKYMSISPTSSNHVARQFADDELLILEGGNCEVGLESTIVALLPGDEPRLLRPGMVSVASIEAVLGRPLAQQSGGVVAPGQHHKHYSPGLPCYRYGAASDVSHLHRETDIGWIFCGNATPVAGKAIELGADPDSYAQGLYDALYQLDHGTLSAIYIAEPPHSGDWQAVQNRLERAAKPL
ncbi:L-threonylcarbamoyladenylate synthase [Shewanella litorisediminis]|uniref:Threonylcarbamoyl-AMP synthase n=1 Tax=Shewanella litorisediminis TaxID=1173586 RepID=A0ABX7G1R1_9GAMM|nr:L-threonylcarbamoyladenylate synthase [Shewanella litorisediminis]MCL2918383.1 threonylcarbamoyl-AMP synthase [Shewanella litorisediminis]QRH01221.1 threonylcarbamoyl-AMP synthase [Shewanella litorisediminis]